MEIELTKDADKLFCLIYKRYLEDIKSGKSKSSAKQTGSSKEILERHFKNLELSFEDVDETCRELSRSGFLHCIYADDVVYHSEITDKGIIYMEQRFKNGLAGVVDFIAKFF